MTTISELVSGENQTRRQLIREYWSKCSDIIETCFHINKEVGNLKIFLDSTPAMIANNIINTYELTDIAKIRYQYYEHIDYNRDNLWQVQQTNGYQNYLNGTNFINFNPW